MREYVLETENFRLSLSIDVFESDVEYASNAVMKVIVVSDGFSANTEMDIDVKEFAAFAEGLLNVYDTLKGETIIKEPFGHQQYVEFKGGKNGHITVEGYLRSISGTHGLRFENSFDQTYLRAFAKELAADFAKYKK